MAAALVFGTQTDEKENYCYFISVCSKGLVRKLGRDV